MKSSSCQKSLSQFYQHFTRAVFAVFFCLKVFCKAFMCYQDGFVIGNARNQGNRQKYLENCQNSRMVKLGLGVKKKKFAPATWAVKLFCF